MTNTFFQNNRDDCIIGCGCRNRDCGSVHITAWADTDKDDGFHHVEFCFSIESQASYNGKRRWLTKLGNAWRVLRGKPIEVFLMFDGGTARDFAKWLNDKTDTWQKWCDERNDEPKISLADVREFVKQRDKKTKSEENA